MESLEQARQQVDEFTKNADALRKQADDLRRSLDAAERAAKVAAQDELKVIDTRLDDDLKKHWNARQLPELSHDLIMLTQVHRDVVNLTEAIKSQTGALGKLLKAMTDEG